MKIELNNNQGYATNGSRQSEQYEAEVLVRQALVSELSDEAIGLCPSDADRIVGGTYVANRKIVPVKRVASWYKAAAAIVGFVVLSGVTVAGVNYVRGKYISTDQVNDSIVKTVQTPAVPADAAREEATEVLFDNETLENVMTAIAEHYGMKLVIMNNSLKDVRLYYTFDTKKPLDRIIKDLNHFKKFAVKRDSKTIYISMP